MPADSLYKSYLELEPEPIPNLRATHLKVELYYSLGGTNVFTYKDEPRGYYLSVSPVSRKGNWETYVAFTGLKQCILSVKRQTPKKAQEALSKMNDYLQPLIDKVLQDTGLQLKEKVNDGD